MIREILIYGDIYSWTASEFVNSVNALDSEHELVVRVCTDGGDPEFGFGMSAKYAEFEGSKKVKVDGKANSTGLFFICTAKHVEALDASSFVLHRASYGEWIESNPDYFTEARKARLSAINDSLKASFEAKVDVEAFEKLKGVTVDDVFSMDQRMDVVLTAKEAKKIGLISKIIPLNSDLKASISSNLQIAAKYGIKGEGIGIIDNDFAKPEPIEAKTQKKDKMTVEEFKTQHPEAYAATFNAGKKAGIAEENDRVGAWAAYIEVDPKAVAEGIKGSEKLSQTAMADFSIKMASNAIAANVENDNADDTATDTPEGGDGAEPTAFEKMSAQMDKKLGINQKK